MGEVEGQRHVVFGFVAGVSEHHTLVPGTLLCGDVALHTALDVGALLVDGAQDAARVAVEAERPAVIAYAVDEVADYNRNIDVSVGSHFAGHHHLAGGDHSFYGDFGCGVECEELVEQRVAYLVGNLVGMPFGN